jgi:hypothetical protein
MKWRTITNVGGNAGYMTVRNDSGSALTDGQVVAWDIAGTEDMLRVIDPGAATGALVAGLADSAIASSAKGLVQVYGVKTNAIILHVGAATSTALALGDVLDILSSGSCLKYQLAAPAVLATTVASNAAVNAITPMFVMAQSLAVLGTGSTASSLSHTTTAKVFIRCL